MFYIITLCCYCPLCFEGKFHPPCAFPPLKYLMVTVNNVIKGLLCIQSTIALIDKMCIFVIWQVCCDWMLWWFWKVTYWIFTLMLIAFFGYCINLTFDSAKQNMDGCWILYASTGGPYWCNYFCLCCQTKRYHWDISVAHCLALGLIVCCRYHLPWHYVHTPTSLALDISFFFLIFLVDIHSINLPCNTGTYWIPKTFTALQSLWRYSLTFSWICTSLCFISSGILSFY